MTLLLVLLVLVGGLWIFFELADEIDERDTQVLDEKVLLLFREQGDTSDPIGPLWVEEVGRDITALGGLSVLAIVTIGVCGYLALRRRLRALALVAVSTLGAVGLSLLVKQLIGRPRPDLVEHYSHVATASFPSGHSMLAAAVYLTLAALLAQLVVGRLVRAYLLLCALVVTFLVGVSRVYLGVHYPTDVLAGWSLGVAWATLCLLVARALQRRGQIEMPAGSKEVTA